MSYIKMYFFWSQQAPYLLLTSTVSLVTSLVCWSFGNPTAVLRQGRGCVLRHLGTRGAGRDHRAFHWSDCSQPVQEHSTWGNYFHKSTPCQWIFERLDTGKSVLTAERDSPPWFYHLCGMKKKKKKRGDAQERKTIVTTQIKYCGRDLGGLVAGDLQYNRFPYIQSTHDSVTLREFSLWVKGSRATTVAHPWFFGRCFINNLWLRIIFKWLI